MLLLCCASCILHRRVWYRVLPLRYACIRRSGIILTPMLPLCQILFLSCPPLLSYPVEKIGYSITHSPSLFGMPETEAHRFRKTSFCFRRGTTKSNRATLPQEFRIILFYPTGIPWHLSSSIRCSQSLWDSHDPWPCEGLYSTQKYNKCTTVTDNLSVRTALNQHSHSLRPMQTLLSLESQFSWPDWNQISTTAPHWTTLSSNILNHTMHQAPSSLPNYLCASPTVAPVSLWAHLLTLFSVPTSEQSRSSNFSTFLWKPHVSSGHHEK